MHYVYHPEFGRKLVETAEYERLLDEGWYDTPAKFPSADEKPKKSKSKKRLDTQPEDE